MQCGGREARGDLNRDYASRLQTETWEGPPHRLNIRQRVAYASGNLGKSAQWNTIDLLYLFFLTDIVGIPPATAGAIILLSLLWDGAVDPILGYLTDRFPRVYGDYSRLLLIAAPFSALAFVSIFLLPRDNVAAAVPLAFCFGLLFRTAYALVDIPHNAMLASISHDSRERSTLSALRFFFSALGTILVSLIAAPLLASVEQSGQSRAIEFAVIVSLLYLVVMFLCALGSPRTPRSLHRSSGAPLRDAVIALWCNRRFLLILAVCSVSSLLVPLFGKFTLYFAKSWLGDPAFATRLIVIHAGAQLCAMPLWTLIANRSEKRTAAIAAHSLLILAAALFAIDVPATLAGASIVFVLMGVASGGIYMLNWAILPDTLEYYLENARFRFEAFTFGVFLFFLKVAGGIGTSLVGLALALSGYDPTADTGARNVAVAGLMCGGPMLGAGICILLLSRLRLTHADHARAADAHRS